MRPAWSSVERLPKRVQNIHRLRPPDRQCRADRGRAMESRPRAKSEYPGAFSCGGLSRATAALGGSAQSVLQRRRRRCKYHRVSNVLAALPESARPWAKTTFAAVRRGHRSEVPSARDLRLPNQAAGISELPIPSSRPSRPCATGARSPNCRAHGHRPRATAGRPPPQDRVDAETSCLAVRSATPRWTIRIDRPSVRPPAGTDGPTTSLQLCGPRPCPTPPPAPRITPRQATKRPLWATSHCRTCW
jgi:hypothetical protein